MAKNTYKVLLTVLILIIPCTWLSASEVEPTLGTAVIVSPNTLIINDINSVGKLESLINEKQKVVTIYLSWTESKGHRTAEIEIVSAIYNRKEKKIVLQTRQWLPYTLSGEVIGLPVVLNNINIQIL